jgi:hypothetical protein
MDEFFEEAGRRLRKCLDTRTPDDETGGEEVRIRLAVDITVAELVRWICAELDMRYESMLELIFNYGVVAFLREMRDAEGWIYQRKKEKIDRPRKLAEARERWAMEKDQG